MENVALKVCLMIVKSSIQNRWKSWRTNSYTVCCPR